MKAKRKLKRLLKKASICFNKLVKMKEIELRSKGLL